MEPAEKGMELRGVEKRGPRGSAWLLDLAITEGN